MVGMGHIYRALTLARCMDCHEVVFACTPQDRKYLESVVGNEFPLIDAPKASIVRRILKSAPDIVINDILDSEMDDVLPFLKEKIKVINFEDLGPGAQAADLVINELYDHALWTNPNTLWGRDYFCLRDEFLNARRNQSVEQVKGILLVFGGTDQHDLSRKVYEVIRGQCRRSGIMIFIVTGPGYRNYRKLEEEVGLVSGVMLTHATGVISSIMESTQHAITSNGRTVYELAHMRIPGIVIPQHDREKTHAFACQDNGYLPIPTFSGETSLTAVKRNLAYLLANVDFRKNLFEATKRADFVGNKNRVIGKILE